MTCFNPNLVLSKKEDLFSIQQVEGNSAQGERKVMTLGRKMFWALLTLLPVIAFGCSDSTKDNGDAGDTETGDTASEVTAECGDGVVQAGEECDDGDANSNTGSCLKDCTEATCGDGYVGPGEACDDGNTVNDDECSNACAAATCGDGIVQDNEECDDGNKVNDDDCSNACLLPVCGDSIVQEGEDCDDGNNSNTDDCVKCADAVCGDGYVGPGEACDDGNTDETDDCLNDCKLTSCGDGVVQDGEDCDDGNNSNTDDCLNTCVAASCGDGYLQAGEQCDDGNSTNGDECTNECMDAVCGDGILQTGVEACDDGNDVDDDECTNKCRLATCGDGVLQDNEECDDGNNSNTDDCLNTCLFATCGDGYVGPGEECDDENRVNTDSCLNTCFIATCGDGVVLTGIEACDDGNTVNDDDCTNMCTGVTCGDGVVQDGEECDDGNNTNTDDCLNTCIEASCGDGFVQAGEQCDDANTNSSDSCVNCADAVCGDGVVEEGVEACDDGNTDDTDACKNDCSTPDCGDGVVQGDEECDDGNDVNDDACTNICTEPVCGDGIVQTGEECDDGNDDNTDLCLTTCMDATCGDGYVGPGEACDDGNDVNDDACSNTCGGIDCGDGIVQAGEECDDGNDVNNDACLNTCVAASCGDNVRRMDITDTTDPAYEGCDDGQDGDNNDECLETCAAATCGDGYVRAGLEDCDDGNTINGDGCSSTCTSTTCGDGVVQAGEECDDGTPGSEEQVDGTNGNSDDNRCTSICLWNVCGDGLVCDDIYCGTGGSDAEQCDDAEDNSDNARCKSNCWLNRCGDGDLCTDDNCDEPFRTKEARCDNTCGAEAGHEGEENNGICNDGGEGAQNEGNADICDLGTDCSDCGIRPEGSLIPGVTMRVTGNEECDDANADDQDECIIEDYAIDVLALPTYIDYVDEDDDNGPNCVVAQCGDTYLHTHNLGSDIRDGVTVGAIEECDEFNSDNCVEETCKANVCGDGVVNSTEDLCSNTCNSANDGVCDDGFGGGTSQCAYGTDCADCGTRARELCDDGNTVNDDGCNNECISGFCGDGIVQTGEACDDGNAIDNDACDNNCATPNCGNGTVDHGTGDNEECDAGNQNANNRFCTSRCLFAQCGDGFVCDDNEPALIGTVYNYCKASTHLSEGEQCDDGNTDDDDSCVSPSCKVAVCGDGYVNLHPTTVWDSDADAYVTPGMEGCDDGNTDNHDDCVITNIFRNDDLDATDGVAGPENCQLNVCGDNFLRTEGENPEVCDDGNTENRDDCMITYASKADEEKDAEGEAKELRICALNTCGDGVVHLFTSLLPNASPLEGCDDGNNDETDACLSTCRMAQCGNGIPDNYDVDNDGYVDYDRNQDGCVCDGTVLRMDADPDDGHTCVTADCANPEDDDNEECDDANSSNTDACLNNCVKARCGDNYVRTSVITYDPAVDPVVPFGCVNGDEAECTVAAEGCDDGNSNNNDSCIIETSSGIASAGYLGESDGGIYSLPYQQPRCYAPFNCQPATCGDGFVYSEATNASVRENCDEPGSSYCVGCSRVCPSHTDILGAQLATTYPNATAPERCYVLMSDDSANEQVSWDGARDFCLGVYMNDDPTALTDNTWGEIVEGQNYVESELARPLSAAQNTALTTWLESNTGNNPWIATPHWGDYSNWKTDVDGDIWDGTFIYSMGSTTLGYWDIMPSVLDEANIDFQWGPFAEQDTPKKFVCEIKWPTIVRPTDSDARAQSALDPDDGDAYDCTYPEGGTEEIPD